MAELTLKYLFRILSDFIIITLLLALYLCLHHIWGPITRRGFFCQDESLMYPFRKDTISYPLMYIIGLVIPLIVIIVCTLLENFILNCHPSQNCLRFLVMANDTVLPFLYGFAAERLLKEISKFSLGRLRPYFFAACDPIAWDGTTCADEGNYNVYILDYVCRGSNGDARLEQGMRSSFPSGHTSLAFYGVMFAIYYLHRFSRLLRRYCASFGLLVPLLQFVCVLLAWFVAISRVMDYKHHWSDVLAGGLLGASVAIAVSFYVHGQIRGVGTFLEAVQLPKRILRPSPEIAAAGSTMSVVSTQVSDISRTGNSEITEVQVHG